MRAGGVQEAYWSAQLLSSNDRWHPWLKLILLGIHEIFHHQTCCRVLAWVLHIIISGNTSLPGLLSTFFLFIWTLNFIKILSEYMAMIQCSFLDLEIHCLLKKKENSCNCYPPCVDPSLNLTMCKHKKNSLNKPKPGTPQNMQEIPKFSSAAHPATMDPLIPEQYNNKCIPLESPGKL